MIHSGKMFIFTWPFCSPSYSEFLFFSCWCPCHPSKIPKIPPKQLFKNINNSLQWLLKYILQIAHMNRTNLQKQGIKLGKDTMKGITRRKPKAILTKNHTFKRSNVQTFIPLFVRLLALVLRRNGQEHIWDPRVPLEIPFVIFHHFHMLLLIFHHFQIPLLIGFQGFDTRELLEELLVWKSCQRNLSFRDTTLILIVIYKKQAN